MNREDPDSKKMKTYVDEALAACQRLRHLLKAKPQEGYVCLRDIHSYSHLCDDQCIKVREVIEE